jgi:tripartite-type tricarboxylate transporter receptor subunit TctC
MHREVQKALSTPVIQQRLAQNGIDPMPVAPAAFDALVKTEVDGNIALVKAAGIKGQGALLSSVARQVLVRLRIRKSS